MHNDTIQGIIFDGKETIQFRDAPTPLQRLTASLLPFVKKDWAPSKKLEKPYKPTFSTDLLPNKATTQSTAPSRGVSSKTRIILR